MAGTEYWSFLCMGTYSVEEFLSCCQQKWAFILLTLVLLLTMLTLTSLFILRHRHKPESVEQKPNLDASEKEGRNLSAWMSNLQNGLPISELSIPGSHDTMTYNIPQSFCLNILAKFQDLFTQCQTLTLSEQLDAGIRFLDIRCCEKAGNVKIFHGPVDLDSVKQYVTVPIKTFLTEHKSEFLIMRLKKENSTRNDFGDVLFQPGGFLHELETLIWKSDGKTKIPSVRQLRGKILVLRDYGMTTESGNIKKYGLKFDDENIIKLADRFRVHDNLFSVLFCGSFPAKWANVENNMKNAASEKQGEKPLYVTFASANSLSNITSPKVCYWPLAPFGWPSRVARYMNNKLNHYLHREDKTASCGIVVLDHPETVPGLTQQIISLNDKFQSETSQVEHSEPHRDLHRDVLASQKEKIEDSLLVKRILQPLCKKSLLTEEEVEELKSYEKEHGQKVCAEKLLQLLMRDPDEDHFWLFLDALLQTGQNKLFQLLDECHREKATAAGNVVKCFNDFGVNHLQKVLKSRYSTDVFSKIPRKPWIEEDFIPIEQIFINLLLEENKEYRPSDKPKVYQHYSEIFQGCDNQSNMYIVLGGPGSGKSTLSQKIMYDWGKAHTNSMFDLVFIVNVRELDKGTKIFENIVGNIRGCKLSSQGVEFIVSRCKALLLLEGLDEAPEMNDSNEIAKVLKQETWSSSHILVTTRPHTLSYIKKYRSAAVNQFSIKGFNLDDLKRYISMYFGDRDETELTKAQNSISNILNKTNLWHVAENPFGLLLICFVYEYNLLNHTDMPMTATDLYEHVLLAFKAVYEQKYDKPFPEDYMKLIGKLAFQMLVKEDESKLIFTEKEVLDFIDPKSACRIGLMTRVQSIQKSRKNILKPQCYFSFAHKSLQEFLAADYISKLSCKSMFSREACNLIQVYRATQKSPMALDLFIQFVSALCYQSRNFNECIVELFQFSEEHFINDSYFSREVDTGVIAMIKKQSQYMFCNENNDREYLRVLFLHKGHWLNIATRKYAESGIKFKFLCLYGRDISQIDILSLCSDIEFLSYNNNNLTDSCYKLVKQCSSNIVTMKLHGCELSANDFVIILTNIFHWPNIRCIDLSNNPQDPSTQPPALSDMSVYDNITLGLEELHMRRCKAPSWLIELLLLPVIRSSPKLVKLNLSDNNMNLSCMTAVIQNIHKWPNIRCIGLRNNLQAPSTQPPVLPDMSVYDNITLGLEELHMMRCKAPSWLIELLLLPVIRSSPKLVKLNLSDNNMNLSCMTAVIQNIHKWPNISWIDLSNNPQAPSTQPPGLQDMSMYDNITLGLEKLYIRGCGAPSWLLELLLLPVLRSCPELRRLDLSSNNMKLSCMTNVIQNIHKWPNIRCIDLGYNPQAPSTQPPGLQDMSMYDNITLGLEKLYIRGCGAPSWLLELLLLPVLRSSPKLFMLNLSDNNMNLSCMAAVIQNIHKWPNISWIDLSNNPQAPSTQPPGLQDMSMYDNITLGLEKLYIRGCGAPSWLLELLLLPVLRSCPELRRLDLSSNNLNLSCMTAVIKNIHKWPNIRCIDLSDNPQAPSTQPPVLPDMSVYDNITLGLEQLYMEGCKAPSWLLELLLLPVIRSSPKLKRLNLRGNNMNLSCMTAVIQNIHKWPNIKDIDLSDNPEDPSTQPPALQDMSVYNNITLRLNWLSMGGCKAPSWLLELLLLPVIRCSSKLYSLNLSGNNMNLSCMTAVIENIHKWPNIKDIDLSDNPQAPSPQPPALPDMSVYNNRTLRLEKLNMGGCKDPWVIELLLLPVIRSSPRLKILSLGGNNLNLSCMTAVIKNIHKWPNIRCIDLSDNPQAPSTQPPVLPDMSVYDNITLRLEQLYMEGCKAPSWLIELLLLPVIRSSPKLLMLKLRGNNMNLSCMTAVIQNIYKLPNIWHIDLRDNLQDPSTQPPVPPKYNDIIKM